MEYLLETEESQAPDLQEETEESLESAPPLWDKERQQRDQEAANARKAEDTDVKKFLTEILGAKTEAESLQRAQEAQHQKRTYDRR